MYKFNYNNIALYGKSLLMHGILLNFRILVNTALGIYYQIISLDNPAKCFQSFPFLPFHNTYHTFLLLLVNLSPPPECNHPRVEVWPVLFNTVPSKVPGTQ